MTLDTRMLCSPLSLHLPAEGALILSLLIFIFLLSSYPECCEWPSQCVCLVSLSQLLENSLHSQFKLAFFYLFINNISISIWWFLLIFLLLQRSVPVSSVLSDDPGIASVWQGPPPPSLTQILSSSYWRLRTILLVFRSVTEWLQAGSSSPWPNDPSSTPASAARPPAGCPDPWFADCASPHPLRGKLPLKTEMRVLVRHSPASTGRRWPYTVALMPPSSSSLVVSRLEFHFCSLLVSLFIIPCSSLSMPWVGGHCQKVRTKSACVCL